MDLHPRQLPMRGQGRGRPVIFALQYGFEVDGPVCRAWIRFPPWNTIKDAALALNESAHIVSGRAGMSRLQQERCGLISVPGYLTGLSMQTSTYVFDADVLTTPLPLLARITDSFGTRKLGVGGGGGGGGDEGGGGSSGRGASSSRKRHRASESTAAAPAPSAPAAPAPAPSLSQIPSTGSGAQQDQERGGAGRRALQRFETIR